MKIGLWAGNNSVIRLMSETDSSLQKCLSLTLGGAILPLRAN